MFKYHFVNSNTELKAQHLLRVKSLENRNKEQYRNSELSVVQLTCSTSQEKSFILEVYSIEYMHQCFQAKAPLIFTTDMQQLYPKGEFQSGIHSKILSFQVELPDGSQRQCYSLSFFEQAYIQNVTSLSGSREKILTWNPQLELTDVINSRNPLKNIFNSTTQVFVEKSIVISCLHQGTGCEASLVTFCKQLLGVQNCEKLRNQYCKSVEEYGEDGADIQLLDQLLKIHTQTTRQKQLSNFDLNNLKSYLEQHHSRSVSPVNQTSTAEDVTLQELKNIKVETSIEFKQLSNQIEQVLYHINPLDTQIFNHPKQNYTKKSIRKQTPKDENKQQATKITQSPLIKAAANNTKDTIIGTKVIEESRLQTVEFIFHEAERKQKASIFKQSNPSTRLMFKKL